MQSIRSLSPVLRAVGVIGVVAALVTSITFAALNDSATLTGNTLSTTNADLQVYDFAIPGWAETAAGFDFNDLVPGTPSDAEDFYLRNNGGVDLDLSVSAANHTEESGVTADKIDVTFYGDACATDATYTLAELLDPGVAEALPCSPMLVGEAGNAGVPGTAGNYTVSVTVAYDAVDGTGPFDAGVFDLSFDGVQVVPTP